MKMKFDIQKGICGAVAGYFILFSAILIVAGLLSFVSWTYDLFVLVTASFAFRLYSIGAIAGFFVGGFEK